MECSHSSRIVWNARVGDHEQRALERELSVYSFPASLQSVAVYVFNINQPSLPTPFHSVLVSVSVFMSLSTVFHSINSPENSPLFHCSFGLMSALLVLSTIISRYESLLQPRCDPLWLTGLKAPTK